jgi:hypothetical protein
MTETNTDTDANTDVDTDSIDPDELHEQAAEMYRRKNADYGESWRLAGETLNLWCDNLDIDSLPTDEQSLISLGLFFQRFHKLTRAFNGEFARDELHHESVFDSHHDESTYAQMHASVFSSGQTDTDTDTDAETNDVTDSSSDSTSSTQQDSKSEYRSKVTLSDGHDCTGGYVKRDGEMKPPEQKRSDSDDTNTSDSSSSRTEQPFDVTD